MNGLFGYGLSVIATALLFVPFGYCLAQPRTTEPSSANRADTLALTLREAEARLVQANMGVLAARYGVDAARALVVQAQLFPNPTIAVEQSAYNPATREFFHFTDGDRSNTEVGVQQLILLAGKRDKQIRLAELNATLNESGFFDLVRTLKYTLRSNMVDLYYTQQILAFYDRTIPQLRSSITAAEELYAKRTLLLSELLRLKALLLWLENDRSGYVAQADTLQAGLQALLGYSRRRMSNDSLRRRSTEAAEPVLKPQFDQNQLLAVRPDSLGIAALMELAQNNRPDLKIAQQQVQFSEANLALQNALAVPDVTVGGRYSRSGSTFPDYFALTASIDLPVFNRNQGNIQAAELTLESSKRVADQATILLERDVLAAYRAAVERDRLVRSFDRSFSVQYQTLLEGITASYAKRNITILEFTDFYESYRASAVQILQALQARADAFEQLNYALGTTLFNP
jgi:cobalt-zinc-cadmium efflux system outer membrane protein